MREDSQSMQATQVRPLPRRNRTWAEGRVCAEEGCSTKLSRYNRSPYCWTHQPVKYYIARGRRSKPEAA